MNNPTSQFNPIFEPLPDNGEATVIPEDLVEELEEDLEDKAEAIPHAEILMRLLKQVKPVDFEKWADKNGKVKRVIYQVKVVEEVLRLAKKHEWGLCRIEGQIYLYNGEYWDIIEEKGFAVFLGRAALLMGAPPFESQSYQFKDHLFKQFDSAGYLPRPEPDPEKVLINLRNGTLEVTSEGYNRREFRAEDFLTYQLPFDYNRNAVAPLFRQYLDEVLPDQTSQMVMAEFIGYTLLRNASRRLKLEKALVLVGTGANGKSVFTEIVTAMLGEENVTAYPIHTLADNTGYFRAKAVGKLLNYVSESGEKLGDTEALKSLISGEPQMIRLPYKDPFVTANMPKLAFNTNSFPRDVEISDAFFRRFVTVPFSVTIPEAKQDRELHWKIIQEGLPGVFNWVMAGLDRLLKQKGFTECAAVNKMLERLRKEADSVAMFVEEEGYRVGKIGTKDYTKLRVLYREYVDYCRDTGTKALRQVGFKNRLEDLGHLVGEYNDGVRVYVWKTGI